MKKLASTQDARARRLKAIEAVAVMGMTHKEAASYSGLKSTTVSNLMGKKEVREYVADMQAAQAKRLNVSREQVMEGMLTAIRNAQVIGEPGTEIRGWEQIAKMQGYYAPERHIHEIPEETQKFIDTVQSMRDEDLYQLTGKKNIIQLSEEDFKRTDNG